MAFPLRISAPGEALKIGDVTVVAPLTEQSAVGALSL